MRAPAAVLITRDTRDIVAVLVWLAYCVLLWHRLCPRGEELNQEETVTVPV